MRDILGVHKKNLIIKNDFAKLKSQSDELLKEGCSMSSSYSVVECSILETR